MQLNIMDRWPFSLLILLKQIEATQNDSFINNNNNSTNKGSFITVKKKQKTIKSTIID